MAEAQQIFPESPPSWDYFQEGEDEINDDVDLSDLDSDLRQEMERLLARRLLQALPSATVTLKFTLNSGERLTRAQDPVTEFGKIKKELASTFNVPYETLLIYHNDHELPDNSAPCDLGVRPFSALDLRLQTRDPQWQLKSSHLALPTPDILTVSLDESRAVVVEIENRAIRKPYLGGFRDRVTGLEYHHAFTQTQPPAPKLPPERRLTRDTQTIATAKKSTSTVCEASTQSGERMISLKVLTPRTYRPVRFDKNQAVGIIQKYFRGFLLRKRVKELSAEYRARETAEIKEAENENERIKSLTNQEVRRMACPKTKQDFEVLYAMVDRWSRAQAERISSLKTEAPKKAELCSVLEKEVKLLESIEAHRIKAKQEQDKERTRRFLLNAAQPVKWTGYRGMTITMDTLRTQRARELAGLYDTLEEDVPSSIRVERLIALKHAINSTNSPAAFELTELIDREAELLTRGAKKPQLEFLRARIQQMFVRYFQETYSEQPDKSYLLCRQCDKVRPKQAFNIAARDCQAAICTSCRSAHGKARTAQDYRHILRAIRRDEQHRGCFSSCAFVMSLEDTAFLVSNIWHGRSILSQNEDLKSLRLIRWDLGQDWAPWNCVLLTSSEARLHERGHEQYAEHLIQDVQSKHVLARVHFAQLDAVDHRIRDTGVWTNVDQNFVISGS